MSSIQQLPPELLAATFQSYATSNTVYEGVRVIPWVLGQVCHDWRMTALSTPRLWNHLGRVIIEDSDYSGVGRIRERIDEVIRRSGQVALTFELRIIMRYQRGVGATHLILQSFFQAAGRWKDITIHAPSFKLLHDYFGSLRGQLPFLQTIKLRIVYDGYRQVVPLRPFQFLGGASDLRSIDLYPGQESYNRSAMADVPLLRLQNYRETANVIYSFPEIVETAPNLQTLDYTGSFPSKSPPQSHIHHRCLRHLELKDLTSDGVEVLTAHFTRISLPALETLTVSTRLIRLEDPVDIFPLITILIANSACPLKQLTVKHKLTSSPDTFVKLFSHLPLLEELDLGRCPPTSSSQSKVPFILTYDKDKTTLLPNLASLCLTYLGAVTRSDAEAISQLVSSRTQAVPAVDDGQYLTGKLGCPLTRVRVCTCDFDRKARYNSLYYLEGLATPLFDILDSPSVPTTDDDVRALVYAFEKAAEKGVEMNYRRTRQLLATVDLVHAILGIYDWTRHKGKMLILLQNQQLLAHLEPWIARRRWMFAGSSDILYVPPGHPIRSSYLRWDVVLGGDFGVIPFMMDPKNCSISPSTHNLCLGLQ